MSNGNGIYTALSGAMAQERKIDAISNNIANVNTTGFKGDNMLFESFMPKEQPVVPTVTDKVTIPVEIARSYTELTQGAIVSTGGELDLAIEGKGFFVVETPQGPMYTRDGRFRYGENKEIITMEGHPLLDKNGSPMSGEMKASQVAIVDFEGSYSLEKVHGGLYKVSGEKVDFVEPTNVRIRQGFLEKSNVNSVKEMTRMITATRGYESYQKLIRSFDESSRKLINEIGKGL